MDRWQNKVAVVTGASSGIGATCAKYLVNNGMIVVGLARRKERIEALRSELADQENGKRLHAFKCDMRNEEEINATFAEIEKKFGPVAVLVNNAGIARNSELVSENNSEDLRAIIETNVMGVAYCTREAFRSMKANGGEGHVIIINSVAGHKVVYLPDHPMSIYSASKHAVTAMTENYRREFMSNKTKVKITSISPGFVGTEALTEETSKIMENMPRLNSEDIADAVIYCLQTPPHVQIHELTIRPVGEVF